MKLILSLAKGAFLLTPSYELSIEKASSICEKMNFKSSFSLTKTATGILFKFENPEDYQAVFKKAFHKVTGARFYKKVCLIIFICLRSGGYTRLLPLLLFFHISLALLAYTQYIFISCVDGNTF